MTRDSTHWKANLSAEAYCVLFEKRTERPGSSPLNTESRPGIYVCAACETPLFSAAHKFNSGTGWPSFSKVLAGAVLENFEYRCAACGGHHGHLFHDGPAPTGLRYCNNGASLKFITD